MYQKPESLLNFTKPIRPGVDETCFTHGTWAGMLPISTSFLCCLAAHLSAIHVTMVTAMLAPTNRKTTSVPQRANLLDWQSVLKSALPMPAGIAMSSGRSCSRGCELCILHVQVWIVSTSGALPLSMWAQMVVIRVRRRVGRSVARERRARRVYF